MTHADSEGRSTFRLPFAVLAVGILLASSLAPGASHSGPEVTAVQVRAAGSVAGAWAAGGAGFTQNVGQVANRDVSFYIQAGSVLIGLGTSEVFYVVRPSAASPAGVLVLMTFLGSRRVKPVPAEPLAYRSNFYLGSDPAAWRTGVPSYAEILYADVYDGVDLVFRVGPEGIEYVYQVRAGADASRIVAAYDGASGIRRADDGRLLVSTPSGGWKEEAPRAIQDNGSWPCSFEPRGLTVTYRCAVPNPSGAFVIDPLIYATYLGGSGGDAATSVAVDGSGNAFIAGLAGSADFPTTPGAFNRTYQGGCYYGGCGDAFVLSLNQTGSALLYATFLGGSGWDIARGIRVDGLGAAYVTGNTSSLNFPTTSGAFDRTLGGASDAFVAKLSPTGGSLDYSTLLGGGGTDLANAIAVDSGGNAYVTGLAESSDFPTTAGAYNRTYGGPAAFVTKVGPDGRSLVYSTFLGSTFAGGAAIDLDSAGDAYITGSTTFSDFPTTTGAFNRSVQYLQLFVTKVNGAGSGLAYSTFLGGRNWDFGTGISVDAVGEAFVAGFTNSTDFPTTPGAFNTTQAYLSKAGMGFVTKFNAAGSALAYSTFLGGTWNEVSAITVDAGGHAFLTGQTAAGFPVTPGALQETFKGTVDDAFVAELNAAGSAYLGATYLGGTDGDVGTGVALGSSGSLYVVGATSSADFPISPYAYDQVLGGYADAFAVAMTSFTGALSYRTTVDTSPSGLQVLVNGTVHTAPYTFYCVSTDGLALNVTSPQLVNSTPYVFESWSDGGAQQHTVGCNGPMSYTAAFTASSAPDFILIVNPTEAAVNTYVNNVVSYYVTVVGLNAYAGPAVNVSLWAPDPGITGICEPQSLVTPTGSCRMAVQVGYQVPSGQYTLFFEGTNGTASHSTAALLDVSTPSPYSAYFTLAASPVNLTMPAGESASTTVWINWSQTTSNVVDLSAWAQGQVGVTFSTAHVMGNGTATVTFVVDGSLTPGTYLASVTGAFGTSGLVQSVGLHLVVTPGRLTPTVDVVAWSVAAVGLTWAVIATIMLLARRRRRPGPPQEPPP